MLGSVPFGVIIWFRLLSLFREHGDGAMAFLGPRGGGLWDQRWYANLPCSNYEIDH